MLSSCQTMVNSLWSVCMKAVAISRLPGADSGFDARNEIALKAQTTLLPGPALLKTKGRASAAPSTLLQLQQGRGMSRVGRAEAEAEG